MSTDLHAALRAAVAEEPYDDHDVRGLVHAGARRVRRRVAARVGASALAVAAVLVSVVVLTGRPDRVPVPADVVRLDISQAERVDLQVLASVRTTYRESDPSLTHDRFDALTEDGLVLRNRSAAHGDELGLLDPSTGTTDWLPTPPVRPRSVVELTAERLVLLGEEGLHTPLLELDRRTRTWSRTQLDLPSGLEVHSPFHLAIAGGRLYLGSTFERRPDPITWWSYSLPEGDGRREPALLGAGAAWGDGFRVVAHNDGRVELSSPSGRREVADRRPRGCPLPTNDELAGFPPDVGLAGGRAVVSYLCDDQFRGTTVVHDGDEVLEVPGTHLLAADDDRVLLSGSQSDTPRIYLLDLDRRALLALGTIHGGGQVSGDLVLWSQEGPGAGKDVDDTVWKVARLPRRG